MICQNCKKEIEDGSNFCRLCGAKQEQKKVCPKCGFELPTDAAFCSKCGAALSVTAQSETTMRTNELKQADFHSDADYYTSKKGFYINSLQYYYGHTEWAYSILHAKYTEYHNCIYYIDDLNNNIKLIEQTPKNKNILTTINSDCLYDDAQILNVNATGIYVCTHIRNKSSILCYSLNGTFIRETPIPLTPNEAMYTADIWGTKLYYTTVEIHNIDKQTASYCLDMQSGSFETLITEKTHNCSILDIVGSKNNVYLNLQFESTKLNTDYDIYEQHTAAGWYVYNIINKSLSFLGLSDIQPHTIIKQPELFINTDSDDFIPPQANCWDYILSFDIAKQLYYYVSPNDNSQNYTIYSASLTDLRKHEPTYWTIPYKNSFLNKTNHIISATCSRHYFDNQYLYWTNDYNDFYVCTKTGTIYNYTKDNFINADKTLPISEFFEVLSDAIYLPYLNKPEPFITHSDLLHHFDPPSIEISIDDI